MKRAVSGGGDGRVKLWDLQDGRELLSMAGHTAEVVGTSLARENANTFSRGLHAASNVSVQRFLPVLAAFTNLLKVSSMIVQRNIQHLPPILGKLYDTTQCGDLSYPDCCSEITVQTAAISH